MQEKKRDILYIYTVEVEIRDEKVWLRRHPKEKNVDSVSEKVYKFKISGTEPMTSRPVIVGSGPAGLFCALMLARHGFRPIVLERGEAVEQRLKSVQHFWQGGALIQNPTYSSAKAAQHLFRWQVKYPC